MENVSCIARVITKVVSRESCDLSGEKIAPNLFLLIIETDGFWTLCWTAGRKNAYPLVRMGDGALDDQTSIFGR